MRNVSASLGGVRATGCVLRIPRADAWAWGIALAGILSGAVLARFDLSVYPGAIAVLCFTPLFVRLDRKTVPGMLIGPAFVMYLYHALGYALGPIGQEIFAGYVDIHLIEYESGFVRAQWGCVLGLCTFAILYPNFFRWVSDRLAGRYTTRSHEDARWAGYGVVMAGAAIFIIAFGFFTGAGNRLARIDEVDVGIATVYASFQLIHQVMFFFLGYVAARRRGGWIIAWGMLYSAYALFFLLDGGRGTVATAGIISAVGWDAGGASRKRILLAMLAAAVAFAPVSGIVDNYRDSYLGRPGSLEDRVSEMALAAGNFSVGVSTGQFGMAEILFQRVTAHSGDRVFELTPREIPFAGLEGVENVLYSFVPRVIRPDRPVLVDGNELAIRYGVAPPGTSGNYMPAVADGYRRFWWPGVSVQYGFSAFLFGVLGSLSWSLRARREWMAMLIFVTISASEIMISTLLSSFYTLLWVMPKYFLCFWILRRAQDLPRGIRKA